MRFTGIIPPVVTPFHADGSIDQNGYGAVIEFMLGHGVHGIIAGGTTGEYYALSKAERIQQFTVAKDIINGRVPLICGVNDISTHGACEYAVAAKQAGVDGLLIAAPYYSLPSEIELAAHCAAIDEAANLPVMLYNYPGRTGVNMGREFLDHVVERPNFRCIKEASGDINRVHLLASDYPQIDLSCGAEDQALEFFVWGATSWVTPMGNFFAEEVVAFYDTCVQRRDFDTARKMMHALLPLTTVLEASGKLLQCTKLACAHYELPAGPVRKPMQSLDAEMQERVLQVLDTAKAELQMFLRAAQMATTSENSAARAAG